MGGRKKEKRKGGGEGLLSEDTVNLERYMEYILFPC